MGIRTANRFVVLAALLVSCKSTPTASPQSPTAVSPSGSAPSPEPAVSIVDAAVVVSECPEAKTMNVKLARDAIRKLVDPCASVPGGSAHFAAILQPNGTIELAGPSGDPAEGVVPTCVLKNKLAHKVLLKSACKFDVKLDERPGSVTPH